MNKLLTTIVGAALGLTMTVGVGVAVANSATKETSPVHAAENESHAFSQSIQQVLNGNAAIDSISISEQSFRLNKLMFIIVITRPTTHLFLVLFPLLEMK